MVLIKKLSVNSFENRKYVTTIANLSKEKSFKLFRCN